MQILILGIRTLPNNIKYVQYIKLTQFKRFVKYTEKFRLRLVTANVNILCEIAVKELAAKRIGGYDRTLVMAA